MNAPADYAPMTIEQAAFLKKIVGLGNNDRRDSLREYAQQHGAERLVEMFSLFIGLANSVVENNRECIELFGILNGEDPHMVERYNLPTIFGALMGVELAATIPRQRGLCHGCAYRLGTPANQSPVTTDDADYIAQCDNENFWCHEHLENELPTKVCGGHKQRVLARQRAMQEEENRGKEVGL